MECPKPCGRWGYCSTADFRPERGQRCLSRLDHEVAASLPVAVLLFVFRSLTAHDASVSTYSYSNITTLNKKILSPKHPAACHCVTTARLILERSITLIIRASTLQAGCRISGVTNSWGDSKRTWCRSAAGTYRHDRSRLASFYIEAVTTTCCSRTLPAQLQLREKFRSFCCCCCCSFSR
jgi:hypothetical protein